MAYYEIGTEQLNADYTPSAKAPFDARRYVGTFEELLSLSTFKSRVYEGMEVVVVEENCIYQLLALEEAYKKNNAYKQFSLDIDLKRLWKRTNIETITEKTALTRAKENLVNGALIYIANDVTEDDGNVVKSGFYYCKSGEDLKTVGGEVTAEQFNALSTLVGAKANQTALDELVTTVNDNKSEVEEALAERYTIEETNGIIASYSTTEQMNEAIETSKTEITDAYTQAIQQAITDSINATLTTPI